jgi:CHAT domain-containing protein
LWRSAKQLDDTLLRPLALSDRRLIIISTGVLGQLPWGLFPSVRAVPVSVASSSTAWLAAHSRRPTSRSHAVVALAGPDLARASHEAEGIAAHWGHASVHRGAGANRAQLRDAMRSAGLVHVAAHGAHQTENPLFSSLRLADGLLFAHELDQTARTPDHVVLSACELGLATIRPGDEALGLTSVLLRLGTKAVVAGVARVGDEVAAETMIDYHRRLAAGADSATALAEAVDVAGGVAPFVCFGASWRPSGFGAGRQRRVP